MKRALKLALAGVGVLILLVAGTGAVAKVYWTLTERSPFAG
jgi:hypothetical protein